MLQVAQLEASGGETPVEAELLSLDKFLTKGFPDETCLHFLFLNDKTNADMDKQVYFSCVHMYGWVAFNVCASSVFLGIIILLTKMITPVHISLSD